MIARRLTLLTAVSLALTPAISLADATNPASSAALCANASGQTPPEARVTACSAMLSAGGLTPDQEAIVLTNRAWSLSLQGKMGESRLDYERALGLGPASHVVHNEYALFLLRMGQIDAAIAQYDIALKLRPDAPYSLYGRGLALIRKGEVRAGQDDLAKARRADSKVDEVFRGIGLQP
jgi:lipoprotein NlpI